MPDRSIIWIAWHKQAGEWRTTAVFATEEEARDEAAYYGEKLGCETRVERHRIESRQP